MQPIYLIATDYDDTLVGRDSSMMRMQEYKQLLDQLKMTFGTKWAIVTGRSYKSLRNCLKQFASRGMFPDYLILSEGYIYKRTAFGYIPNLKWNWVMWQQRRQVNKKLKQILPGWQKEFLDTFEDCHNQSQGKADFWFTFDSEESCHKAEVLLNEKLKYVPELILFKKEKEIYLGVMFCAKGFALAELSAKLQIPLPFVFAIGDGDNDISMLNGSSAGMPACVGNARTRVKETVKKANGYIAKEDRLLGVIESINHYTNRNS